MVHRRDVRRRDGSPCRRRWLSIGAASVVGALIVGLPYALQSSGHPTSNATDGTVATVLARQTDRQRGLVQDTTVLERARWMIHFASAVNFPTSNDGESPRCYDTHYGVNPTPPYFVHRFRLGNRTQCLAPLRNFSFQGRVIVPAIFGDARADVYFRSSECLVAIAGTKDPYGVLKDVQSAWLDPVSVNGFRVAAGYAPSIPPTTTSLVGGCQD